jgi:hypothetical protein
MIYADSTTTSSFLIFLKDDSTISDVYLGTSTSLKIVFNKMVDTVNRYVKYTNNSVNIYLNAFQPYLVI